MTALSPKLVEELLEHAGQAQMVWFEMLQSWSIKDRAEAYLHRLSQLFYENVANGADVEVELERADSEWRRYATERNREVDAAPKFSHGPYAGQSRLMDLYVYPDKFQTKAIHLRIRFRILKEKYMKREEMNSMIRGHDCPSDEKLSEIEGSSRLSRKN